MSTTPTLTNAEIDEVVYTCRQAGDDSTYAIVREAVRRAALTQGAGAVEPVAWANMAPEEGEVYSVSLQRDEYHNAALVLKSEAAQQLQQAVARAVEECAVICERAVDSIWEYHEENHKRTGRNVCTNLAAAIRAKGTHD